MALLFYYRVNLLFVDILYIIVMSVFNIYVKKKNRNRNKMLVENRTKATYNKIKNKRG